MASLEYKSLRESLHIESNKFDISISSVLWLSLKLPLQANTLNADHHIILLTLDRLMICQLKLIYVGAANLGGTVSRYSRFRYRWKDIIPLRLMRLWESRSL